MCNNILSTTQSEHVPPMMLLHKTGMLLQWLEIPRKNHEWLQSMQQATNTADAWGIPTPTHHWPWLVRTHMMVEMRHAKIDGLLVPMDWDTATVAEAMLPDQSTWLATWMRHLAQGKFKTLLHVLKYN